MVIKTEVVNVDVTLAGGGELPVGRAFVVFQLTENDVDVADNQVIPSRPVEFALDADGIAVANIWPNDRGERGTFYRVSVIVKDERGVVTRENTYRYGFAQFLDNGGPYSLAAEVFDGLVPGGAGVIKLQARVLLPDGTVALPALSFADQPNTGVFRPATSVLALSVNGTERARFTTSGMQVGGSEVFRRANAVGTVSQSSGVPTGAIIHRGSNSNGEFVRFADGTQICWINMQEDGSEFSPNQGAYISPRFSYSYPATFSSPPVGQVTQVRRGGTTPAIWASIDNRPSVSSIDVRSHKASSGTHDLEFHIIVHGRWF